MSLTPGCVFEKCLAQARTITVSLRHQYIAVLCVKREMNTIRSRIVEYDLD